MRLPICIGLCLAFVVTTSNLLADTTIGSLSQNPNPSGGHDFLGQSFTVPAGETGLISGSFLLQKTTAGNANGTFSVYAFTELNDGSFNGVFGTQLGAYPITIPGSSAPQTYTQVFNVPVVAGNKYALVVDFGGPSNAGGFFSNSSYYSGGDTLFSSTGVPHIFTSYDMSFQIAFGPIPEPATLGILAPLSLLLGCRRPSRR